MARGRVALFTGVAMLAFAGNSLLCRAALRDARIDPASFTAIRLVSGAVALWCIVRLRASRHAMPEATRPAGDWTSALALFVYAIAFSWAYVGLAAGTGALLLFGSVQATMIGAGIVGGRRLGARQGFGLAIALGGVVVLVLPGLQAPPLVASALMIAAGVAWGVYSLRGRGAVDPLGATAGNFVRAAPLGLLGAISSLPWLSTDASGIALAAVSGVVASGIGYAIWYAALPGLAPTSAAVVQLSVPVIAAVGGIVLLAEPWTLRLLVASLAVLGGIAVVVTTRR